MASEKLDRLDFKILKEMGANPRISITELAQNINSSRPTVTNRLSRLEEAGLISLVGGLSLMNLGFKMATVGLEIRTEETRTTVIEHLKSCPRVQTIFRTPGKANLEVGVWGEDDQTINSTVESFRDFPNVQVIHSNYLGTPISGRMTLNMRLGDAEKAPCSKDCVNCGRYTSGWCIGCPATKHYKNPILK